MDARRIAIAKALRGDNRNLAWDEISASSRNRWLALADICMDAMKQTPSPWLRLVQALNGIAMALLGSALVVHQTYPQIITGIVGKLPPVVGIPAIFAFGLIVHFAIRQAKK